MNDFELEDVEGRRRRLSEFRGRPVVLVVAGRELGESAGRFGVELAPELAANDSVVVTVADVGGIPRLARGITRGLIRSGMERAQKDAIREIPDLPPDVWKRFSLLLDWDGRVIEALGLSGKMDRFHLIVLSRRGQELGRIEQGDAPVERQLETVLGWLQRA